MNRSVFVLEELELIQGGNDSLSDAVGWSDWLKPAPLMPVGAPIEGGSDAGLGGEI